MSAQTASPATVGVLFDRLDAIEDKLDRLLQLAPVVSRGVSSVRLPFPVTDRSIESVLAAVEAQSGYSLDDLTHPDRRMPLVQWRMIAMAAVRQVCHLSFPAVGRVFDRDHTTVHSGCRRVEQSEALTGALAAVVARLDQG